jgi:hypothetical protein
MISAGLGRAVEDDDSARAVFGPAVEVEIQIPGGPSKQLQIVSHFRIDSGPFPSHMLEACGDGASGVRIADQAGPRTLGEELVIAARQSPR